MKEYVYFVTDQRGGIKIGHTKNVPLRLASIRSTSGVRIELIGHITGTRHHERSIHAYLHAFRTTGEWFFDCAPVRDIISSLMKNGVSAIGIPETTANSATRGRCITVSDSDWEFLAHIINPEPARVGDRLMDAIKGVAHARPWTEFASDDPIIDLVRESALALVEAQLRSPVPRMVAYERVAGIAGMSPNWVRKLITDCLGESHDIRAGFRLLKAWRDLHTYNGLCDYLERCANVLMIDGAPASDISLPVSPVLHAALLNGGVQ